MLFLLEPGYDVTRDGFRATKILSALYAIVSASGGLAYSVKITVAMAALATGLAVGLAISLWYFPAPVRRFMDRFR